jgi:formate/nitrite transporter FocA (FNT family)
MYNILTDWKFWTFVLGCFNLIGIVLVGCFNYFSHQRLVTNDLVHLSKDVAEIKEDQKIIKKDVADLSKEVGYLKGKIEI